MINKKPLTPTQVSSRNLKNIINDTRIPLSKYIHKRATPTDKNMPYLDKLKQMFNVNHASTQNTKQLRFSDNYMRTQMNTIIHDTYMYDETTPRKPNHGHERAQSGLTNPHVKNSNNKMRMSQKKVTGQQMINQIRNDLIKKRVNSNSTYSTTMTKSKIKSQIVNYNNYLPVPNRNQAESNVQICSKWGKMELRDILGSGANANVRQGYCHNTKFAVKVYQKYKLLQPKKRRRVYSQIQLLKSIPGHPNIIQIYESFQDKRQIHVIFQHLNESITLHQYFRNNLLYLEQRQIQRIFAKIVRGVTHLHEHGIAHRDIKPENILVSFDQDQNMILKIIDFGFATIAHKADLHCGTPNFMAPELLDKCIKYNPLSVDVWALGVTLFYLCQGRYPFKGYDEKDLYRAIRLCKYQFKKITSQPIMKIIQCTLVADPCERITVAELAKFQWVRNG